MVLTGKFTNIPSGNLEPTVNGNKFSAPFKMEAVFTNDDSSDCSKGEYRQYVKGVFKWNGLEVPHQLCGDIYLSKDKFEEDGCPPPGCTAYGYRSCPATGIDDYKPTQTLGCTYQGFDEPSISGNSGDCVKIDLTFTGELINTETNDILESATWTVKGSGTLMAEQLSSVGEIVTKTNEGLSAQASYDYESNAWNFNLIISRSSGLPPIHSSELEVQFLDAEEKEFNILTVQKGQLTEVGGTNRKSAVAQYQVGVSETRPRSLRVKFRGDTYCINLQ
ncbi:MAG: hypothetical protein F6K55_09945 [Moorea sp. SIO4A3]|nr:hypothetical protein [Moorena sp. SIO4A3]